MKNQTNNSNINITFGLPNYAKAFCKCNAAEQERLLGCEDYLGKQRFAAAINKDYQEFVVVDGMMYTITDTAKIVYGFSHLKSTDTGARFLAKFEPTFSCMDDGAVYRVVTNMTLDQTVEKIKAKTEGKHYRYTVQLSLQTAKSLGHQFKNIKFDDARTDQEKPFPFAKNKECRKLWNQFGWLMSSDDYIGTKQQQELVGA